MEILIDAAHALTRQGNTHTQPKGQGKNKKNEKQPRPETARKKTWDTNDTGT